MILVHQSVCPSVRLTHPYTDTDYLTDKGYITIIKVLKGSFSPPNCFLQTDYLVHNGS